MKSPNIKFGTQFLFGTFPQLLNLKFADLIGQRLPRPRNIAVHFAGSAVFRGGDVFQEVVDGLFPCPVLIVHAGVYHQTHCSPYLIAECPKMNIRIVIQPQLIAEGL